jgi:hypothetical protein
VEFWKTPKHLGGRKMNVQLYARRIIVILIVVGLSGVIPEAVNAVLILILVGLVLNHWTKFSWLATWITAIFGNDTKEK